MQFVQVLLIFSLFQICFLYEKIIKLIDLLDDDNYIPIRNGQIFIIEIEGNPSEGKTWQLDNPSRFASNRLIKPVNLEKDNSAVFYQSHTSSDFSNGFYHFKFKASKRNTGHEEITFVYKDKTRSISKTVNVHIISQVRIDL